MNYIKRRGSASGYQALYRVYRPQSFNDVVGQQHIIKHFKMPLSKRNFRMRIYFLGLGEQERQALLKF